MPLEPRIVFDAAMAGTLEQTSRDARQDTATGDPHATEDGALVQALRQADGPAGDATAPLFGAGDAGTVLDLSLEDLPSAAHTLQTETRAATDDLTDARVLVFIDALLPDSEALAAAFGAAAEIHLIATDEDGVQAIAAALAGRSGIDSLHILSHGVEGALQLGRATLDAQTMNGLYADALQGLRSSLAPDADILVYGCDFGNGAAGEHAVGLLAALSGADVAASTDATGTASQGGDWELELHAGAIEAPALAIKDWDHLLTAPVLNATPTLTLTVNEDAGAPVGAVGSLIGNYTVGITDADAGALRGIAITAVTETKGSWYYTVDGGTTWTAVGTVSNTSALLLADNANTRLYFKPNADVNDAAGTASLTLKAWDQSIGAAGSKADSTVAGAYSTATDTIAVTITPVNDAPVLLDKDRTLSDVAEDAAAPAGGVGTALNLASLFIDTTNITDADGTTTRGIAIVGADSANGSWYYSTNSGTNWTALGAVSDASALLLTNASTNRLYFKPNLDFNGTATLTVRAWDQSTGTNGATVNIASTGGTTAYSSATDTATVTITNGVDTVDDAVTTTEDTAKTFNPITGVGGGSADSFEAGSPKITAIDGQVILPGGAALVVSHGKVSLAADGQTLTFTPDADYSGTAIFNYTVTSGGGNETAKVTMTITAVAEAPRIDLDSNSAGSGSTVSYDQGGSALGPAITVADPEGDNISSMTVTLSGATAADSLFMAQTISGISASYSGGVLTLSGSATPASYQAALQAVRFSTTSGGTAARTVTVSAVSGTAPTASNAAVATLTPVDSDSDGIVNSADIDDDNDGILDASEGLAGLQTELLQNAELDAQAGWIANSGWEAATGGIELEGAVLNPNSTPSYIEQTINTVAGAAYAYTVSMYARDGAPYAEYVALMVNGTQIATLGSSTPYGSLATLPPDSITVTFYATGPTTTIRVQALPSSSNHGHANPGDGWGEMLQLVSVKQLDVDTDLDGIQDRLDLDSDNDGITDNVEAQLTSSYKPPSGTGAAMLDDDDDGLDDRYDASIGNKTSAASVGLIPIVTYGGDHADYVDTDTDGDGILDVAERGDGQATSITSTTDTDHDGLLDIFEHGSVNDGFVANDGQVTATGLTVTGFDLADSDDDAAADGHDAQAPGMDLDFRDNHLGVAPPQAIDDTVSVSEDGSYSASAATGLLANDLQARGGSITAASYDSNGDGVADTAITLGVATTLYRNGVAVGTLTLNADGSYVPEPGFVGTDSFTVRVSDGRGGTDSITIHIVVTGVATEPEVFETIDPRGISTGVPAFDTQPSFPAAPQAELNLRGAVFDALDGIGGVGGLNSIGDLGAVDRGVAITYAIENLNPLNSMTGLAADGAVIGVVRELNFWTEARERLSDPLPQPMLGDSSSRILQPEGSATGAARDAIVVETFFEHRNLYIAGRLGAGDLRTTELRVTLADGRAVPDWLVQLDNGLFVATPPADVGFIDLRIVATVDGRVVEQLIRVDLRTGTIQPLNAEARTSMAPAGLFSDWLAAELDAGWDQAERLAAALGG